MSASSTRVDTPNLSKMLLRWCFTASSLILQRSAIYVLERPATTFETISSSRRVSRNCFLRRSVVQRHMEAPGIGVSGPLQRIIVSCGCRNQAITQACAVSSPLKFFGQSLPVSRFLDNRGVRRRFMQPAASLDPRNLRSAPGRPHPNPLLLLCRLMVEKAFRCACQTHDGMPTEDARDAVEWLTVRLDWTRDHGPIPPPPLRVEYWLSYEYCCAALGLDPDETRRQGLPRDVATLDPSKRRQRTRPRNDHGRNSRPHVAGLPAVLCTLGRQQHSDTLPRSTSMNVLTLRHLARPTLHVM